MEKKEDIKRLLKKVFQSKVAENYFSMTSLSILSPLIGILLYSYLIRVLGENSYGLYVFALSITSFFLIFIKFGFSLPAMKTVVEYKSDIEKKRQVLSAVFTAKMLLLIVSVLIISILYAFVPIIQNNSLLFLFCFASILVDIIFPQWYFQAIQKMKFVTIINLTFRVLAIPFVFIFIKNPQDNWIYALIVTTSMLLGGITATYILWKIERIFPKFVSIKSLKNDFRDALPFFWATSVDTVKIESITLILGFFSMADVAMYDLANKIVSFPRILTDNINSALFPKMETIKTKETLKKVIRFETIIGLIPVAAIAVLGYWTVLLMGGHSMLMSYPLAIIICLSIPVNLILGSYVSFVFVAHERYRFIAENQLVTLAFYVVALSIGLLFFKNILVLVSVLTLTSFFRIAHCKMYINKNKLL